MDNGIMINNVVCIIDNLDLKSKAIIQEVMVAPYYEAEKEVGYRLWIVDANGFLYHVSCNETLAEIKYVLFNKCGFDLYKTSTKMVREDKQWKEKNYYLKLPNN